jgi:prevent-host-death family protein
MMALFSPGCQSARAMPNWSKRTVQIGERNMTVIGLHDARTQLPKLLERVRRGERFLITMHGRPVAQLVPAATEAVPRMKEIIRQMQEWQEREGPTLGPGLTIRELREEGRRF